MIRLRDNNQTIIKTFEWHKKRFKRFIVYERNYALLCV